jgi:hypothetical protein
MMIIHAHWEWEQYWELVLRAWVQICEAVTTIVVAVDESTVAALPSIMTVRVPRDRTLASPTIS